MCHILGLETVVPASPSPHANLSVSINLLYNPLSLLKQMLMAWVHLFLFIRKQLIAAMHIVQNSLSCSKHLHLLCL